MNTLELAAQAAADLRDRERRFALGYTDHGLTRAQVAAYYRRQAAEHRRLEAKCISDYISRSAARSARLCDRRAKEYER